MEIIYRLVYDKIYIYIYICRQTLDLNLFDKKEDRFQLFVLLMSRFMLKKKGIKCPKMDPKFSRIKKN
jgi:hypothetical protein